MIQDEEFIFLHRGEGEGEGGGGLYDSSKNPEFEPLVST